MEWVKSTHLVVVSGWKSVSEERYDAEEWGAGLLGAGTGAKG